MVNHQKLEVQIIGGISYVVKVPGWEPMPMVYEGVVDGKHSMIRRLFPSEEIMSLRSDNSDFRLATSSEKAILTRRATPSKRDMVMYDETNQNYVSAKQTLSDAKLWREAR